MNSHAVNAESSIRRERTSAIHHAGAVTNVMKKSRAKSAMKSSRAHFSGTSVMIVITRLKRALASTLPAPEILLRNPNKSWTGAIRAGTDDLGNHSGKLQDLQHWRA
jgi:hypothetical protein